MRTHADLTIEMLAEESAQFAHELVQTRETLYAALDALRHSLIESQSLREQLDALKQELRALRLAHLAVP